MNEENLAGMQERTEGDSPETPRRPEEPDEKKPEQAEEDAEHARNADDVGTDDDDAEDDDDDDDDEGMSEYECLAYSDNVYVSAIGDAVIGEKMAQEFRWGAAEGETGGCWTDDEGHIYNRDGDMLWECKGSLLDYFAGLVAEGCDDPSDVYIGDVIETVDATCGEHIELYDLEEYDGEYLDFAEKELSDLEDEYCSFLEEELDEYWKEVIDSPEIFKPYLAIQRRAMQMLASRGKSDGQDS